MSEENIRNHLRAALNEIVASEKYRLHKFYDDSDVNRDASIEMMGPIIEALNALKNEIVGVEFELEVSTEFCGTKATAYFGARVGELAEQSISIESKGKDTKFRVENFRVGFGVEPRVDYFELPEDALKVVIEAAGHHMAMRQVLDERKG